MKKNLFTITCLLSTLILPSYYVYANKDDTKIQSKKEDDNEVLAKYNSTSLTRAQVNKKLKALLGNNKLPGGEEDFDKLDANIKNNILREMVINELLGVEVTKSNIEQSEKYKADLKEFSKQLAYRELIDSKGKEFITEEKLQSEYKKFVASKENKEEVRARHILVNNEEEAKNIINKLKKGGSFEELAKEKSSDNNKFKGGDLGYFSQGQMVKPFEDAVFKLKVGEITESPVKTEFGWHIIKLEDKRKAHIPTFEEIKPRLEKELFHAFIMEYTEKLLKDAKAEFFVKDN